MHSKIPYHGLIFNLQFTTDSDNLYIYEKRLKNPNVWTNDSLLGLKKVADGGYAFYVWADMAYRIVEVMINMF